MKDATLQVDRMVTPVLYSPEFKELVSGIDAEFDTPMLSFVHEDVVDTIGSAMKFDCKALPYGFLLQTGQERQQEMLETGEGIQLPYTACTFEFGAYAVVAYSVQDDDHETVEGRVLPFTSDQQRLALSLDPHFEIGSRAYQEDHWKDMEEGAGHMFKYAPLSTINDDHPRGNNPLLMEGGLALLGLLTLFEEKLMTERKRQAVPETINKKREKAGVAPVPSYRVLTLNLAETRRRAKAAPLQHHESPMLHWRRGHWRTLGRGSEFETRTWVKRCLVGDPDKGFVSKHYKPVWVQTIH